MNSFTKEELLNMLELVDSILIINRSMNHDELQNKIQYMIDNYCEHLSIEFVGNVYGYNCKKCNKLFCGSHAGYERYRKMIENKK